MAKDPSLRARAVQQGASRNPDHSEQVVPKALEWLREKWTSGCPYCGSMEWTVGPPLQLVSGLFADREDPLLQTLAPVFLVLCDNCGNTVFVNVAVAGLLPLGQL